MLISHILLPTLFAGRLTIKIQFEMHDPSALTLSLEKSNIWSLERCSLANAQQALISRHFRPVRLHRVSS